METSDTLNALRRRLPIIAVIVVFAVVVAWVTTPGRPTKPKYTGTANLSVQNAVRTSALTLEPVSPDIVAGLATSGDVPARAKARLNYPGPPDVLASQVHAKATKAGVVISTTQPTKKQAAAVADAFAAELTGYLQQRQDQQVKAAADQLNQQLSKLNAQAADLDKRLASAGPADADRLKLDRNNVSAQAKQVQQRLQQLDDFKAPGRAPITRVGTVSAARVSSGFSPPTGRLTRTAVAALLGLVLGVGLALLVDYLDPTIRTRRQAERAFGFPVIAEIPALPRNRRDSLDIITASEPRSAVAETYRNLRTATSLMAIPARDRHSQGNGQAPLGTERPPPEPAGGGRDPNPPEAPDAPRAVILVTSPGPGDGRTVAAVNLAASFAEAGNSALLVGADMRRPAVHRYFDLPDTTESAEVIRGANRPVVDSVRPTSIPGLSVLPGGFQPNPAELLSAQRERLAAARTLADVVVVDTPPLLVANDAVELMEVCDAVVLVARAAHTTLDAAERASELLLRLDMPVVGVVMIGLTSLPRSYRRYYDDKGGRSLRRRRRAAPVAASPERVPGPPR